MEIDAKRTPKIIIKLSIIIVFIMIILFFIYRQMHFVKLSEIEQYVAENHEYLTDMAEKLLAEQEKSVEIYYSKGSLPKSIDAHKLYFDLRVQDVFVGKNHLDYKNYVSILLKNKNGNYSCGIYYSPDDLLMEYGTPKEGTGDTYEYDGMQEGIRHRYRANKICDNWYYYEDDTWN
jgi:hypothetical protein